MEKYERMYGVNFCCPSCKEDHLYAYIQISQDEQKQVEEFYEANKNQSSIEMVLKAEYPLWINRTIKCGNCGEVFEQEVPITRESYAGEKKGVMRSNSVSVYLPDMEISL